jgi:uncharacterized membrane protein
MIDSVWPYAAVLLPIVLTYLFVTAPPVAGAWQASGETAAAQRTLTSQLLSAPLFLLMIGCDLRAILWPGPRVLAVFASRRAAS